MIEDEGIPEDEDIVRVASGSTAKGSEKGQDRGARHKPSEAHRQHIAKNYTVARLLMSVCAICVLAVLWYALRRKPK